MTDVQIGSSLSGHDNKSFFYEGSAAPACATCSLVTDLEWVNPDFKLVKTNLDFSYTYDDAPVASSRFVKAVAQCDGATYLPLPSAPGFFLFVVRREAAFDAVARRTKSFDECPTRGRMTQVAGAMPVILKPGAVLASGFSRTDLVFGSASYGWERKTCQGPVFLADPDCVDRLTTIKLRGLVLEPIKTKL